jgi:hypothetical protein
MRGFLQSCLAGAPASQTDQEAAGIESDLLSERDSELKYYQGTLLAYCGKNQAAVDFLRKAIEQNYCANQALREDPLLKGLRGTPEYTQLLAMANRCQQKFLAERRSGY